MPERRVKLRDARRLTLVRQHLDGHPPTPMLDTIRDLGCLQLDPISAVARSHEIVLWSRQRDYDLAEIAHLRFQAFQVIEYWAHAASMVLTEDYPLYAHTMRRHATGDDPRSTKIREWVQAQDDLRRHILHRLEDEGPLPSRAFQSQTETTAHSVGWTSGRDITHMMDYLWNSGQVMVAGREGNQRLWGLTAQFLPAWTPREVLTPVQITERAAQKSLRALGVATMQHVKRHFTRGRYPDLKAVLARLVVAGRVLPVKVVDDDGDTPWPGQTYIHADDLPLLEQIEAGDFQPRTTLLSPFDNLICDRQRTEQLWDFVFRIEIYVPKDKREYGYYVLPILHRDRLIGRIDPVYDANTRTLTVNRVYAEADAPDDAATVDEVRGVISDLADWLGAEQMRIIEVPARWGALRG